MKKRREIRSLLGHGVFRSVHGREYTKKFVFHALLLSSVLSNLPMYIAFIIMDAYEKSSYAFHNLQSALLFMAYSMMIRDWSKALFEMNEFRKVPFLLSKWSLILVNICFTIMTLVSFAYLFVVDDIDQYLHSVVYPILMCFQIVVPFTLSAMMLYTGLHLQGKIQESVNDTSNGGTLSNLDNAEDRVAVDIMYDERNRGDEDTASSSFLSNHLSSSNSQNESSGLSREQIESQQDNNYRGQTSRNSSISFRKALYTLNSVMVVQLTSIVMQILMLLLNWLLGYSTSSDKTFVPSVVYWILYAWLPLCGMVLSLLYLARSSSRAGKTANYSDRISGSRGVLDPYVDPDVSVTHYDDEDYPYTNMNYYEHQHNVSDEKQFRLRFSPENDVIISSPIMTIPSNESSPDYNFHVNENRVRSYDRDTVSSKDTTNFSVNSSSGHANSDSNNYVNMDGSDSNMRNSSLIDLDVSLRTRASESPHRHGLPMSLVERDSEVETVDSSDYA